MVDWRQYMISDLEVCHGRLCAKGGRELFFTVLALVVVTVNACATLPPQTRPATPEKFVGEWTGPWNSSSGRGSGWVDLTIYNPVVPGADVQFWAGLTNAVVPGFGGGTKFRNGELLLELPTLTMIFRLHGDDRLEVDYDNRRIGDSGTWSLTRKKK